jgi:hypothetical protein
MFFTKQGVPVLVHGFPNFFQFFKMTTSVNRKEEGISTKELDWFDFETRMRDVIHELIEPVIKRASEDREVTLTLQRRSELH